MTVVQQAPDCDMALIHDDDLLCLDDAVCSSIVDCGASLTLVVNQILTTRYVDELPSEICARNISNSMW